MSWGLYTLAEERDFDHIAGLSFYTTQVQQKIVHALWKNDESCDLNPLPGSPSYSLTKLEQEAEDFGRMEFLSQEGMGTRVVYTHSLCNNGRMYNHNTVGFLGLMCRIKGTQRLLQIPSGGEQVLRVNAAQTYGRLPPCFPAPARKGGVRFTRKKGSDGEVELGIPT